MNRTHWMYVSQWNLKVGAPGLTLCAFDAETGEIEVVKQLDDRLSLGCSHIDRERNVLSVYAINTDGSLTDSGHHAFIQGAGYVSFY